MGPCLRRGDGKKTRIRYFLPFHLAALSLTACAPQASHIASAPASISAEARPGWAFETSDIPVDAGFRFGLLDNGMRYVIRHNATPSGTAIVRMEFATGSLDEAEDERGYAHFVEHMAFNGSAHVPEGEMVRLLERHGLAFGADTNASTGFEHTTYKLDLPRNDPELLDVALMLMRETASELTFDPQAVDRERGVVLAEMRDRNSYQLRNALADAQFMHPGALYPDRFPIGTAEALTAATAQSLKAFWAREYVPAHTTLIVIGDFEPEAIEAAIREKFADWQSSLADPQPGGGPVDFDDGNRTGIYLDPALSERLTVARNGPWLDEPDSVAQRQENLLRQIGYSIVNRRLERLSRDPDPPFRGAGYGTGGIFKAGRTTRLIVDTVDGKWRRGLLAATIEYRKALQYGFAQSEITEQLATIRTAVEDSVAAADTRPHHALAGAIFQLLHDGLTPSHPRTALERLDAFAATITPERVLDALRREALPLTRPLLRLRGRVAPKGGERAIRNAWKDAMRQELSPDEEAISGAFAYTDFGPPGLVASDRRDAALGIRELRLSNGVMLNIRHTGIERDTVLVKISIDGGARLKTMENPLATEMVQVLPNGGLGKHSQDELQSILAGRTVQAEISTTPDTFVATARTTPRDLRLQLQVMAAYVTDPGYRPEGEVQFRHTINNYFARMRATPGSALASAMGGILSDDDPRFTLQPVEAYRKLTFAGLKEAITDRLNQGTIEIGIVGDIEEDTAIKLVADTFGALPARENDFRSYEDQPPRTFTADRTPRVIRHSGPDDQALLHFTWLTRDDSDPIETLELELLERVVRIKLTESLRETLGKAYAPGANSQPSRSWPAYGTFTISASVDVHEVPAARSAISETIAELQASPVDLDLILRARQPMIEAYDNALKSNRGWLALVDRAQTQADRIDRYLQAKVRLQAITGEQLEAVAQRYLKMQDAVPVLVLPEGVDAPAP